MKTSEIAAEYWVATECHRLDREWCEALFVQTVEGITAPLTNKIDKLKGELRSANGLLRHANKRLAETGEMT